MKPPTQLKLANCLMVLAAVLIPVSFYRFLTADLPASIRMSQIGEGLSTLGGLVAAAFIVGVSGLVWSLKVEKRHPSAQVMGTYPVRILIFLVCFAPIVFSTF